MPQRRVIDQSLSFAQRDGTDIRLVLHVPDAEGFEPSELILRRKKRLVTAPVQRQPAPAGAVLEARVPAQGLPGRGVWQLRVPDEAAANGSRALPARLLVRRGQPVALIVGPRPTTRLPEPAPRSAAPAPSRPLPVRLAEAGKRRAVRIRRAVRSRRAAR